MATELVIRIPIKSREGVHQEQVIARAVGVKIVASLVHMLTEGELKSLDQVKVEVTTVGTFQL